MEQNYGELVKEAIFLLDKFTAGRASLDDFIEDAEKELQDMEPESMKFILDLVSGCIEYKKLLDIVINPFVGQGGKLISKRYHNHFVVICYLTIFHFDDLGLKAFSNIVKSLDIKSIHNFLRFFFMNLTTWIQDEWNRVYDVAYVKDHWIAPLLRKRSEIEPLMEKLAAKVSGEMRFRKAPPKTTDPIEFSFYQQKPSFPQCVQIPGSTYRIPRLAQLIEEVKQRNQEMSEELLYEVNSREFGFARPRRTDCTQTQRLMYQLREDMESKMRLEAFNAKAPPPIVKDVLPFKLNTAAMLRRRVLHDRQVEDKLQRIENLVEGANEPSVFLQKEKEMLVKDHQDFLAKIEQRHANVILSHWETVLARAQHTRRGKQLVKKKNTDLQSRTHYLMLMNVFFFFATLQTVKRTEQKAQEKLEEEKEKKELVQQVTESHSNTQKATERVKKAKQSAVKDFAVYNQEMVRQVEEAAKLELTKKLELISEIHALEWCPAIRCNMFDRTEIAGHHELLVEMSHAELKERLFLMKDAEAIEQKKKRALIQKEKQKKKKLLLGDMENINLHSRAMAMATMLRKEEEKKFKMELQKPVVQNKKVFALQKKIEEVKRECQKLEKKESNQAKTSKHSATHPDETIKTHGKDGLKKINWEECLEQYIDRKD
ncbi:cilia- and flagella-associated protein 99-like [Syngnathus acus]|uniref:cilia- and flagella-associated protein 99-like n=1 Tax=Syngnathus acus TaxID=161584 RepID=UPI001885E0E4|nr:cilia- and flagella-associated protein 99-like [Syngnathus acus]